jgi:flagellar FliL protein
MSTKEKAPETDEAEAKGGKKKLILILLVVILAAAGAAYFFLFSGGEAAAEEEPVSSGTFLALDPVAVNLAGGGYLKIGVSLELTEEGAAGGHGGGLDGSKATDLVISTFSQAAPADVTGARDALKEALQQKIVEAYTEDGHELVMDIYYTEYVTQ